MEQDPQIESKSSDLEHVSNDPAANAPEIIIADTTRFIEGYRSAPEVAVDNGLQIAHSKILRKALPGIQQSGTYTNATPPIRIWGLPKKGFLALAIVIVSTLIAALLAIGIKLSILNQKQKSSDTRPSPSARPLTPIGDLLDDTSLAAIVTENGDRHIFFQDYVGAIRHALRPASSNTWITAQFPIPLKAHIAKMHTPLEVIPYGDNRVTSIHGVWYSTDLNITILTREDSRHLRVTQPVIPEGREKTIPLGNSSATRLVTNRIRSRTEENYYVIYQGLDGEISGVYNLIGYENEWHDVGNSFRTTVGGPNATGPFITQNRRTYISNSTRLLDKHIEEDVVEVCRVKIGQSKNGSRVRKFSCFLPTNSTQLPAEKWAEVPSYGGLECEDCSWEIYDAILLPSLSDNDALLGWVNDNKLSLANFQSPRDILVGGLEIPALSAFFPYTRLAMGNWLNSSFLYHQLDGFKIEEIEFDHQNRGWISSTEINLRAA